MKQIREIAELLKSINGSYKNLCSNGQKPKLNKNDPLYGEWLFHLESNIIKEEIQPLVCYASTNSYCVNVDLISANRGKWCIDFKLASREIDDNQNCLGKGTLNDPYRCPESEAFLPLKIPFKEKIPFYFQASILDNFFWLFRK